MLHLYSTPQMVANRTACWWSPQTKHSGAGSSKAPAVSEGSSVSRPRADKFWVNIELPDHGVLFSSRRTEAQLTQSEPGAKNTKVRVWSLHGIHWRAGLDDPCGSLPTQNILWFKCGLSRNVPTQSAQKGRNLCLSINYLNGLMQPLCSQSAATPRNRSNPKPPRTLIITEYAGGELVDNRGSNLNLLALSETNSCV